MARIVRTRSTTGLEGMLPPPDVEGVVREDGSVDPAFHQQNRNSVDQTQRNVRNIQGQLNTLSLSIDELKEALNATDVEEDDESIQLKAGDNITITQRGNTFIISSTAEEAEAGDTYAGQFKVTDNGDNTVDVSKGTVINGTDLSFVSATAGIDVTGATYLSLEVWWTGSWNTGYLASSGYPTQDKKTPGDYWTVRFLISQKVDDVWTQQRFGEFHNTRAVKD